MNSPSLRPQQRLTRWFATGTALLTLSLPLVASEATVSKEPETQTPFARFNPSDTPTSVAWYYTSDAPLKTRDIAQTIQVDHEGIAKGIALKLSSDGLHGLSESATYELKVYEAPARPDRNFISRSLILTQGGVLTEGSEQWLLFTFNEPITLKPSHFYTFALSFTASAVGNRVLLAQSPSEAAEFFRWHRSGRGSWVPTTQSLHFILY